MKKHDKDDEMLDEYDFKEGVRGKYADRFETDTIVVTLDQDVAQSFPDSKSVNAALRIVIQNAKKANSPK